MSEREHLEALYGKAATHSEHKIGDTITFREGGQTKQGVIIWVRAPGPAFQGGKEHGVLYVVETDDDDWPSMVAPGEVIAE